MPVEIRKENPADYRTVENLTREAFWGCMDHPTCDGEHLVFIQEILIFPTHQRKGVGSALTRAVLDKYRHGRQIKLTSDDTPEAIGFYTAMGFFSPFMELFFLWRNLNNVQVAYFP